MVTMTAFADEQIETLEKISSHQAEVYDSILRLFHWLEANDYQAYDTFDGLNAKFIRPLTFEKPFLLIALQQSVRRFPLNLRRMLGIKTARSSKAMGYFARGFLHLAACTGDAQWADKAELCLQWLMEHQLQGYSGACWGNHFDYQSRSGAIPKGVPTVVWTSLIGYAFLDAYEQLHKEEYLRVAISISEHIMRDLRTNPDGQGLCINYTPGPDVWVHNANTLGGAFLARTYAHSRDERCRIMAQKALCYTAEHQRQNGAWFYGEKANLHWVDNFHTAYVLDCFKHYAASTEDKRYDAVLERGYSFWKHNFFLPNGTPRYYDHKTLPLDIQCASQAIETLTFFADQDAGAAELAIRVARWAISHMQDPSGYFYYRRYSRWLVNKTPTLHWGQATMFCALAGLYRLLSVSRKAA